MTAAESAKPRDIRDRPIGPAPKGTAWGLGAILVLAIASVAGGVFSAADWLPLSLDGLLGSGFGSIIIGGTLVAPLAALGVRRYWVVVWYFYAGVLCLTIFACAVGLAVAEPLHAVRVTHTNLTPMVWVGRIFLLAALPMCVPLVRALSLKYYQPWTAPSEWECGDERNSRLATAAALGRSGERKS